MTRYDWLLEVVKWIVSSVVLVMVLSACTSTHGWSFGIGVYPINAVTDSKTFDTTKAKKD